jgi:hypothetical protein
VDTVGEEGADRNIWVKKRQTNKKDEKTAKWGPSQFVIFGEYY